MITLLWTWLSGWALRLPWQVYAILIAGGVLWIYIGNVEKRAYNRGYLAAVAKVEEMNNAAVKKANDAVEALRRVCASKPDECLRDEWTRDNLR